MAKEIYGAFRGNHDLVGVPNLSGLSNGQLYGGIKKAWKSVNIHNKNREPAKARHMSEVAEAYGDELKQRSGRNTIKMITHKKSKRKSKKR